MYLINIKTVLMVLLIVFTTALIIDPSPSQSADVCSGQPVNIEDFPFVVIMTWKYRELPILATIVNEWFILTTRTIAHFISRDNHIKEMTVRVGTTNLEGGQIYALEKAILYKKNANSGNFFDDNIGLIKLATPLTFGPTVAAATFAAKRLVIKTGTEVNITKVYDIRERKFELKRYVGSYLSKKDCQRSYTGKPWNTITRREFCVLEEENYYPTVADGSPLVWNGKVVGLSLWNFDPESRPGVYLKISPYMKWIERRTAPSSLLVKHFHF